MKKLETKTCNRDCPSGGIETSRLSRRALISGAAALALPGIPFASLTAYDETAEAQRRFPHFGSVPVSYFRVKMQDTLWAPRQRVLRDVTIPWASCHFDGSGGLKAFKADPQAYKSDLMNFSAPVAFIGAMASVVGLQRDSAIEGMTLSWGQQVIGRQQADGYSAFAMPPGNDRSKRWQPIWYSEEDFTVGHYVESSIAFKESTGNTVLYDSAVRAVDNMAAEFLGSSKAYAPAHPEIEQALMELYSVTGNSKYLRLCEWLIRQRGNHSGRPSYGKYSQDHLPVEQQRTIEGHAVRAAFLFNGVTEYVGATGDPRLRETVLAVWNDFANHKMYIHGAGGLKSTKNEGYSSKPDFLPVDDCYGESCSVYGNFRWAHNLFRLTGDASYIDVAERMLYNAFLASLSSEGDRYFYENPLQTDQPILRFAWHPVPCCPPNIVKLFAKIGGFLYSTDRSGIYVKHYAASEAQIPFGRGVRLVQRTQYPWQGDVTIDVQPETPMEFILRLRKPQWAASFDLFVNGKRASTNIENGWLAVQRRWKAGDKVELALQMDSRRITWPARFTKNQVALERGPIVYCVEEQDTAAIKPTARTIWAFGHIPQNAAVTAKYLPNLLGGVTALQTELHAVGPTSIAATFVPYGLWNNRTPGGMRVWVASRPVVIEDLFPGDQAPNPEAAS